MCIKRTHSESNSCVSDNIRGRCPVHFSVGRWTLGEPLLGRTLIDPSAVLGVTRGGYLVTSITGATESSEKVEGRK